MPTVSLVGYTNAGKSTLFNALTGAGTYVADQLFATLDPTLRRLDLPGSGHVVLSDTVGFIRDLPHDLVAAFRATLEEATQSDLLLVVIDAADPQREERAADVIAVLREIGADALPSLTVMNQIDRLDGVAPRMDRNDEGVPRRVWLSARTGQGIDLLLEAMAERMRRGVGPVSLEVPPNAARLRARLHAMGVVTGERHAEDGGGWVITVHMDPEYLRHLCAEAGVPRASEPAAREGAELQEA
jgi:GTP-binding protein HflX